MDLRTLIYRYCNYQERCHKEVRNKLLENRADEEEINQLITELIEENMLNEERYARAFARGKFRMKQWGRRKIVYELKQHDISEYCIRKALTEIDEDEYLVTLKKLTANKALELKKEQNVYSRKSKLYRYLTQKGFESDLVQASINEVYN